MLIGWGAGKVRRIEVCHLWVQDIVAKGTLGINKIGTKLNLADAFNKYVDSGKMGYHIAQAGGSLGK